MTCRVEDSITYRQTYNAENRIASIAKLASGSCATPGNYASKWDFAYDGDGTRTATLHTPYNAGTPQTAVLTAYYFGGSYELTNGVAKKYYSFGGQTMMRDANGLQYFLTDHLGSTVAVTNASGTLTSQQRYLPFGQVRTDLSAPQYRISSTDFGYTGQRDLDPGMGGLMDYNARFYSPYINHFTQPDTIVPDLYNPQAWNRYAYTLNNPIRYNDPTGHCAVVCVAAIVVGVATIAGAVGGGLGYAAYTQMSGEEFDSTSFLVATIGGGLTAGVATTGFIVSGFNPGVFLGLMGAGNAAQYAVDRALHDDPVNLLSLEDDINLVTQFGVGVVGGVVGGTTSSSFLTTPAKRIAIEFGEQTFTRFGREAGQRFLNEMMEETAISSIRSSVSTFTTSFINRYVNNERKLREMEKE